VIYRTYLGLDIHPTEISAVALRRQAKGSLLLGTQVHPLPPSVFKPSLREPNILDVKRFQEQVKRALVPLAGREDRIALSLPESSGQLILTEVETALGSKDEGREILRWQLKSHFPIDPKDVQLDYQIIEKTEGGRFRLAVAFIAKAVLHQFEEILSSVGFNPAMVDFHSLSLYNYYRPRIDLGGDFFLIGIEESSLSIQFFQGHNLGFHRSREVEPNPHSIFQELLRTLVSCTKSFPLSRRAAVFLHTSWPEAEPLHEAVRAAFSREVILLDPHLDRMSSALLTSGKTATRGLVAAIGAAERMM